MMPAAGAHCEKGFIWGVPRLRPLDPGSAGPSEMCSGVSQLQSGVFFSIGHSFPAVAFVVLGPRQLEQMQAVQRYAAHDCFASPWARTA